MFDVLTICYRGKTCRDAIRQFQLIDRAIAREELCAGDNRTQRGESCGDIMDTSVPESVGGSLRSRHTVLHTLWPGVRRRLNVCDQTPAGDNPPDPHNPLNADLPPRAVTGPLNVRASQCLSVLKPSLHRTNTAGAGGQEGRDGQRHVLAPRTYLSVLKPSLHQTRFLETSLEKPCVDRTVSSRRMTQQLRIATFLLKDSNTPSGVTEGRGGGDDPDFHGIIAFLRKTGQR
ncbi:hypothetical protein Bbelb_093640 [Branchiostoma belcheri]|nr:hypothetical protein Bbelb_093640 [Branchiostoma belcheri]